MKPPKTSPHTTQTTHTNRKPTFTHQIFKYLDANGDTKTPKELADTLGFNISIITSALNRWRIRNQPDDTHRCTHCTFAAQDNNPILEDGICLWCHADMANVDLGKIAMRVGWDAIIEAVEKGTR